MKELFLLEHFLVSRCHLKFYKQNKHVAIAKKTHF